MARKRWFGLVAVASLNLFLLGCKCNTAVKMGGMIGPPPNPSRLTVDGGYLIVACPGEAISLGWTCSDDVKDLTIDNGIGSVQRPAGFQTIPAPNSNTTYTATGKGDCDKTDSVQVIAVQNGSILDTTASLKRDNAGFYWEANLLPQFYSPNVQVTSIQLKPYPDTPPYKDWRVHKVDAAGSGQYDFAFTASWTDIGPVDLAGVWRIGPADPTSIQPGALPGVIHVDFKMKCKV